MSSFTIKEIFIDHWSSFKEKFKTRPVVDREVARMLGCGDFHNGYTLYSCPTCGESLMVPFRCHSRFCNTCAIAYQQDRASSISSNLIRCRHRHVVFTIPEELRELFRKNRDLLHVLYRSAADVLLNWFKSLNKSEAFTPGIVAGLHTFGRDLKWNPHIHILLSEGAIGKVTPWKKFDYFPFNYLRKSWMTLLLRNLKDAISVTSPHRLVEFKSLVNCFYKKHKEGFYVNAPSTKFNDPEAVAKYITRYIARPAMAQSRIKNYDGTFVTYWYRIHEDNKIVDVTEHAHDFIKKLIIHIPEKSFNMLRYYGAYAKPKSFTDEFVHFLSKQQLAHYKRVLRKWNARLILTFNRFALLCECGSKMKVSEIWFPGILPKRPPYIKILTGGEAMSITTYTVDGKKLSEKEYVALIRKQYMEDVPEGYTAKEISKMSDNDLLDMDYFLNE